jgi:hypothetical protein
MATTEHTINDALASILRETRRAGTGSAVVSSENTGMLKGGNRGDPTFWFLKRTSLLL